MSVLEKQVDDAVNKARQLMEKWKNRLTLDNRRFGERYLKGDLELHILLKICGATDTGEFCAILKVATQDKSGTYGQRFDESNHGVILSPCSDEKRTMFVDIVKLLEMPE